MKWVRELKKLVREADVVVEVVDARDPEGTRIRIAERIAGKKLLIVANKADLVKEGKGAKGPYLKVSAKERTREKLLKAIKSKSGKKRIKALFIGYPNVGKSSLINMLALRKAAKVSPIAGTTKGPQWVRIDENVMATDYRGIFPPQPKEELSRKFAINVEKEPERFGYRAAKKILEDRELKEWVEKALNVRIEARDEEEVLIAIAKRRNLYLKGGEPNIPEACKILMRILRNAPKL